MSGATFYVEGSLTECMNDRMSNTPEQFSSEMARDKWRMNIYLKYGVKWDLRYCTDKSLVILEKQPFLRDGKMNPLWLLVDNKICLESPVQACLKFYRLHMNDEKAHFVIHEDKDVDAIRECDRHKLERVMRLVDWSNAVETVPLNVRRCGICDFLLGNHSSFLCPLYPTFAERLFKVATTDKKCGGCGTWKCRIGRNAHRFRETDGFLCNFCKSYTHIEELCENPCVWKKWRRSINEIFVVFKATKDWTVRDHDDFYRTFLTEAVRPKNL